MFNVYISEHSNLEPETAQIRRGFIQFINFINSRLSSSIYIHIWPDLQCIVQGIESERDVPRSIWR